MNSMADIAYNTASFPALLNTLTNLRSLAKGPKNPLFVMGYKEREEAERTLWEMCKEEGIEWVKAGEVKGYAEGDRDVEVWIA